MMNDSARETAVFGGGCFWCTEAIFLSFKGVLMVKPGYTGGKTPDPHYQQVLRGDTGHVESIWIEYDPKIITFEDLLAVFFNTHDPTTLNRQGNDIGTQYASAIFYSNDEQKKLAEAAIRELNEARAYDRPVVTAVRPLEKFYDAEDYHKNYYARNKDGAYCELVIAPKLAKMQVRFANLLKAAA